MGSFLYTYLLSLVSMLHDLQETILVFYIPFDIIVIPIASAIISFKKVFFINHWLTIDDKYLPDPIEIPKTTK